ncbi:hypothetical protein G6F57_022214 [Rhizopus arrhizus]|nr:hypothetical protein G6F57_022214 [Rhizopus arrhizus]
MRVDPVRQPHIHPQGKGQHQAAHGIAIATQVVARQERDGRQPAFAAQRQPIDQNADRAARAVRVIEVVQDVGIIPAQVAGSGLVAVALLGHGQADDAGLRVGDPFQDGVGIFLGDHHAQHRTHHAQLFAGFAVGSAVAQGQGVQAVLRRQRIAGGGAA